jgi:hypothetical protein
MVLEKMALRGILGVKCYEVTGDWRKLREGLHHLYCSADIWVVD